MLKEQHTMVPAPSVDLLPPELLEKIFHGLSDKGTTWIDHFY